jgi:hypothetical protein
MYLRIGYLQGICDLSSEIICLFFSGTNINVVHFLPRFHAYFPAGNSVFLVYLTCFFRNLYQLKNKIKKKVSVKYIKNRNRIDSQYNTKKKFKKHYSFNRYVSDKFLFFPVIFKYAKKNFHF